MFRRRCSGWGTRSRCCSCQSGRGSETPGSPSASHRSGRAWGAGPLTAEQNQGQTSLDSTPTYHQQLTQWLKHKPVTFWGERAVGMGDSDLTFLHRDPVQHTHTHTHRGTKGRVIELYTTDWRVTAVIWQQNAAVPVSGVGRLGSQRGNAVSTGIWNGIILCKR